MGEQHESAGAEFGPAELDALRGLFASVMADNADAILLLDPDGRIEVANEAAADLFGRDLDELIGCEFGHPVGSSGTTEIEILRDDEDPVVVEMHISATRWQDRSLRVATLRDVTRRVAAAAALRDFVSMASHEFRTPLSSIAGFAGTIVEHLEELDRGDIERYANIIVEQSGRLARLADDLLAIARLDAGELPVYVEDVSVRSAVERALASAAPTLDVEVDVPADLEARCDADHLVDMITNYLTNAIKYGRAPYVVRARSDDDLVTVCVEDAGDGVAQDFVDRLFDRFARARTDATRKQPGTGLGLAIVRGTAELHGGSAWHEPTESRGARFCFSVPVSTGGPRGQLVD